MFLYLVVKKMQKKSYDLTVGDQINSNFKNNIDLIDCFHNVEIKLTVTSKYKDQNDIFT